MANPRIRILLVDDHPVVRQWLREQVEGWGQGEVVGEAGDGEEALEKAGELRPDLVLMDIGLPGMNGLEATRRLGEEVPGAKILILTLHKDQEYLLQALDSGASGYLLKTHAPEELTAALAAVARGEGYFSPEMARYLPGAGRTREKIRETIP